MSDQNGKPVSAAGDPANGPPLERRHWIRHAAQGTGGQLSWEEGGRRVTCEATVLDLSGQGSALLADRSPAVSQTVWLCPTSSSGGRESVEARSVAISEDPSGKRLIRIRFTTWVPVEGILGPHQERRLWQRYPAKEKRAALTWIEGRQKKTIHCELLNISGGGAAVISAVEPPHEKSCWFSLEAQPLDLDPVESQVQGTSLDPSGSKIVRLRFLDPCPMALFDLAVHGSG